MTLFTHVDFLDDTDPHGAALNMAIDEVLLRSGLERPLLRVYSWKNPSISFGYFEKIEPILEMHPGMDLVRRWTGGGIVPHQKDLTYSLLVPAGDPFLKQKPVDSYCAVHCVVASLLQIHGSNAVVASSSAPKVSQACFENPVRHDLVADGRKVAGAAQRRSQHGLLHQGSIQGIAVAKGFGQQLASAMGDAVSARALTDNEIEAAETLAAEKYGTESWLRRW
jgi:lipoate-protein ligase A